MTRCSTGGRTILLHLLLSICIPCAKSANAYERYALQNRHLRAVRSHSQVSHRYGTRDAPTSFQYTWEQQQTRPLLKYLEDKRRALNINEDEWAINVHITDKRGMPLFDSGSEDDFPLTVSIDRSAEDMGGVEDSTVWTKAPEVPAAPEKVQLPAEHIRGPPWLRKRLNLKNPPPFAPPWNGSKCSIPQCSYINLERRTDRRSGMEERLKSADIQCSRLPAIDAKEQNTSAVDACRLSHMKALERLSKSSADYGVIFEDDAAFQVDGQDLEGHLCNIRHHLKEHPVILLACNLDGHSVDRNLENIWLKSTGGHCQTSSAYVVRRDYADRLLQIFQSAPVNSNIDQVWKPYQEWDNWAMTWPVLVKQAPGFSDIQNKDENYNAA